MIPLMRLHSVYRCVPLTQLSTAARGVCLLQGCLQGGIERYAGSGAGQAEYCWDSSGTSHSGTDGPSLVDEAGCPAAAAAAQAQQALLEVHWPEGLMGDQDPSTGHSSNGNMNRKSSRRMKRELCLSIERQLS